MRRERIEVHVYKHCYPDGTPFYIGVGRGKRYLQLNSRSPFHHRVQRKIRDQGGEVLCIISETVDTMEEACEIEMELISFYGRRDLGLGPLVNHTNGGQYIPERSRDKSAYSMKGNKNRLGTIQSEETKRKIAESSRAGWDKLTPEERHERAMKGKQDRGPSPKKGKAGPTRSAEFKAAVSERMKGQTYAKGKRGPEAKLSMRIGWILKKQISGYNELPRLEKIRLRTELRQKFQTES